MRKRIITVSLIAAGVILIVVGIVLKQPESVFAKAAKICMECVGIG
jgi:ribosomal protein S12